MLCSGFAYSSHFAISTIHVLTLFVLFVLLLIKKGCTCIYLPISEINAKPNHRWSKFPEILSDIDGTELSCHGTTVVAGDNRLRFELACCMAPPPKRNIWGRGLLIRTFSSPSALQRTLLCLPALLRTSLLPLALLCMSLPPLTQQRMLPTTPQY